MLDEYTSFGLFPEEVIKNDYVRPQIRDMFIHVLGKVQKYYVNYIPKGEVICYTRDGTEPIIASRNMVEVVAYAKR